ncbi:DNA binding methylated-DNA--cysteine S-methyltransferase [Metschnikowia bicuspidata]|uniref:6-O-methylguanine-DNA methyltransferase n=1 Tax=Metschnikowia bicuspidata TaxID=27322 RepID=A0A4P9ZE97_9ASCO|nr:DNA binding methylated-DNA--cysteine S-methyltransferase [Metschnikowia bicuspidata]RKP31133.1 DNA binding methylated-DNA--cysteine S-methyltransferase [Metschnikowia bicuspidata]
MISQETKAFHIAVYTAVSRIPYGSVTSYGHIAELIGRPQNPRQVGLSLKHSFQLLELLRQDNIELLELPWWRVVSSSGLIAKRDDEYEQKRLLEAEGVEVTGMKILLNEYGWFPEGLEG